MNKIEFDTIEDAILDIKNGKMVIVVDNEDRENEGDFVMAGDTTTPEAVNFMATFGRGLICSPVSSTIAKKLNLHPMVENNTTALSTAFTVTIDAAHGISTGISSFDRAYTIKLLTKLETRPEDFVRPGHIFPLIANDNGVLGRDGHTEAAIDLSRLAGFSDVGTICEILDEDGSAARVPYLSLFAKKHNLKLITIKDLIQYRRTHA